MLSRALPLRSLVPRAPLARVAAPRAALPRREMSGKPQKPPVKVAVTGAAGQIGYALLFRIASGAMLGADQPVILNLIELPQAQNALKGVVMELEDCAFPLLKGINEFASVEKGFEDISYALLVGSKPRGPGMERQDLLKQNGVIFVETGKMLNKWARKDAKVLVVGNPANTNCLIAAANAPDMNPDNFTAMTRLDHNRAYALLRNRCKTDNIERLAIWGNHSSTQFPDVSHALIDGKPARQVVNDEAWIRSSFIPQVQQRGAAIIKARGASSAASAANAAIDHIRDWVLGTNQWVSMAVASKGLYGVDKHVYFSYPCTTKDGKYTVVKDLKMDAFAQEKFELTKKELYEERDMVASMLK